MSDALIQIR